LPSIVQVPNEPVEAPQRRVWLRQVGVLGHDTFYEGTEMTGSPEVVLLRGNVLVENDALVASPGIGQYVARAKFGEELKVEPAVA
jgi:hypothetical protein